ncbi:unnamed protein product [Choristocarpus tenellus]
MVHSNIFKHRHVHGVVTQDQNLSSKLSNLVQCCTGLPQAVVCHTCNGATLLHPPKASAYMCDQLIRSVVLRFAPNATEKVKGVSISFSHENTPQDVSQTVKPL